MSNLLLITDLARLRKIFGRLTEDKNIRLRVVNNLEKGGEEIAIEKPDIVFVQTHLSGLSADILLMHLKKQLGRKRSRFVLLAPSSQINEAIIKPYQGWLDISADDGKLLSDLGLLLDALLNKSKKSEEPGLQEQFTPVDIKPQPVSPAETSALFDHPAAEAPPETAETGLQLPSPVAAVPEPSLEEQGVTYAPRQRLQIYSEFNSSFDSAVTSTPEPEPLEQATPALAHDWNYEQIDIAETKPARSKRVMFLLWLVPVVVLVIALTYFQQKPAAKPEAVTAKTSPPAVVTPPAPLPAPGTPPAEPAKAPASETVPPPSTSQEQDRISDKAVLNSIAENNASKAPAAATAGARPTALPDFIPGAGYDKQFSAANPGWERYKGRVTEFKVLREGKSIKAIQIVDRGGQGVPESFMKGALRQVTKNPVFKAESSEKKDGYEIQRGRIAENIKVVYYRDENGGKLRAFVLSWQ